MANTVTGYDGKSPPKLARAIGSVTPMIPFSVTVSGTTTSEAVTFSQLTTIRGWVVQNIDTSDEVSTADATVTASGNVLTIADGGSTFDLDASGNTIYGFVWGDPKA